MKSGPWGDQAQIWHGSSILSREFDRDLGRGQFHEIWALPGATRLRYGAGAPEVLGKPLFCLGKSSV